MTAALQLASLGMVRAADVGEYHVTEPVTVAAIRELMAMKWCSSIRVSDGTGGLAKFTAQCVINGRAVVVTGHMIGGC
ncbi:hypothetical protein [Kitasatospora indigofera]|uniref:hypothetical protein n=1 Tax=Kitasatospora indigofera TaxID=67307 RepID=UPI0036BE5B21